MKYNITTLKKEVPKHIRLEVYKEALKQEDRLDNEGLCLALPKVMLGLTYYQYLVSKLDSESRKPMTWRDASTAFPELTKKVIQDVQQYKTKEKRVQYLEQWIKELEPFGLRAAVNKTLNTEK